MTRGSSIRIYLADGTVTGIRHAEVVNWTGQAIACPRTRISELADWDEAHRPGIYLLFGADDDSGKPAVYVGEAENVWVRLQDHVAKKDFWNEIVLFTNKDENLTKAHVRFLESKVCESASAIGRYAIMNGNIPQPSLLPRGDRDSMDTFLEQVRLLLGVLGHRVLEPLAPPARLATGESATSRTIEVPSVGVSPGTALKLSAKAISARAVLSDEGIVVLSGSQAASQATDSISSTYRKLREQLVQQRILIPDGDLFQFAEDYLFTSPSAAAAVIVGYAINGRAAWKTDSGASISDLEGLVATVRD